MALSSEIRDRLAHEVRVAAHRHRVTRLDRHFDGLACGQRLVEFGHFGADGAEVEIHESVLARASFSTADTRKNCGYRRGCAIDLGERRFHGGASDANAVSSSSDAHDLGARDHQRRAQVVSHVVADRLQLVEQALDLVEHQIDGARDLFDVAALRSDRQARVKLAVHDAEDRAVNALEAFRRAASEHRADRENEEDGRRQRDRHHPQHGLLQVVDLAQRRVRAA